MDKRPLLLRTVILAVVVILFVIAMYPLRERDYYQVFTEMLKDKKDPQAAELVAKAKDLQAKNPQLYQSQALLMAADAKGVELRNKIKNRNII